MLSRSHASTFRRSPRLLRNLPATFRNIPRDSAGFRDINKLQKVRRGGVCSPKIRGHPRLTTAIHGYPRLKLTSKVLFHPCAKSSQPFPSHHLRPITTYYGHEKKLEPSATLPPSPPSKQSYAFLVINIQFLAKICTNNHFLAHSVVSLR